MGIEPHAGDAAIIESVGQVYVKGVEQAQVILFDLG